MTTKKKPAKKVAKKAKAKSAEVLGVQRRLDDAKNEAIRLEVELIVQEIAERGRTVGRPSDYAPAYCGVVIRLGQEGYSKTEIAEALDVHRDTLYEWEKQHPEFSDALSRAMFASQAWWEAQARAGIRAPTASFNAGLFGKVMAARFPAEWRESKDVNLGGQKEGVPVVVDSTNKAPIDLALLLLNADAEV